MTMQSEVIVASSYRLLVVPYFVFLSCVGCSTAGPWHEKEGEYPLVSPGTQAREFCRNIHPPPFVVAGVTGECVWQADDGSRRSVGRYIREFRRALERSGLWSQFPETGSGTMDCDERVAPYRFSLVSIEPSVIIVTPQEYPFDTRRREAWKLYVQMQGVGVACLRNDLELGPEAPDVGEAQWLAPELGGGLRPIVWEQNQAEIEVGQARFALDRTGENILVRRIE